MATIAAGGSLTAASPLLAFQTQDAGIVGVEVSGTWTGTITFEARIGNTWANAQVFTVASVAAAATTTANVSRLINAAGFSEVRANFSTPTSGSPTVIFTGSPEAMGGGGGGGGGGGPATIADGADVAEGTTTDAGVVTDTSGTLIGFARGNIIKWIAQALLLGAVTETAPATDTASSGLNGRLQRVAQRLTSLIALLPASLGGKAAASSLAVTLATDEPLVGILTETAPATDTASSGLNGRLQRVAQRLTSLIALLPSALISNRLDVNLGAAPAVVTTIGSAPAAPTCTFTRPANTTAYTIGDEVGTAGTAPTTVAVARANGLGGIIQGAQVFYSGFPAVTPSLTLMVFSATVTLAGDNAQFSLSDADAAKLICRIPLTSTQTSQYSAGAPVSAGGVWLSGAPDRPAPHFVCGGSETTLYCCLITGVAFTPIANSETLVTIIDVEQN